MMNEKMDMMMNAIVDPSGGADNADPTVAPPLSLRAMMGVFHDYTDSLWTAS